MKDTVIVDFTGVKSGSFYVKPGEYKAKVVSISKEMGTSYPYLKWNFEIVGENTKLFHNTSLQPNALFNLKNVLEALGMVVPEASIKIDPDKLIGRVCLVQIEDKEVNNNIYSTIAKFKKSPTTATNTVDTMSKTANPTPAVVGNLEEDDLEL